MISFRAALRDFLTSQAGVAALVDNRVHESVLPEARLRRLPAVVYTLVGGEQVFTHDGAIPLRNTRIQLDSWANRRLEAEAVGEELAKALIGYRGPMGDLEYTSGWQLDYLSDFYEQDTNLHRISMDFMGWYRPQEEGES